MENKVIFRTSTVDHITHPHHIQFSDALEYGRVCIPRNASRLLCSRMSAANIGPEYFAQFEGVIQYPQHHNGYYLNRSDSVDHGLPKWCPPNNMFLAAASPFWTMLREADVKKLDLAIFHYRIRSQQDWNRKSKDNRMWSEMYGEYEKLANRLDVYDDFMNSTRGLAKAAHPSAIRARSMMEACSPKYFDFSTF